MSRNCLFVQPLPLSNMSWRERLAGLSLGRLASDNSWDKKLYLSQIPTHAHLSPSFLFKQHIDPFNLKHGLSSLDFISKVSSELTPVSEHEILISYALHYCQVLNVMALQTFSELDPLKRFNYVLDLKVALQTCALFGNTRLKRITNLNQVASDLGFTQDLSNQLIKVEALRFIYNYLLKHDPKIMAFLTLPRAQRLNLAKGPYFVHLDDQGLGIIKVLAQQEHLLKALKCNGKELNVITINLDLAPLMAPLGILTPARQQELRYDVAAIIKRLDEVVLSDLLTTQQLSSLKSSEHSSCLAALCSFASSDLPLAESFKAQFNKQERETYAYLSAHQMPTKTYSSLVAGTSERFASLVLCYLVENFLGACFSSEQELYARYCTKLYERAHSGYQKECHLLLNSLKEQDSKALELLKRISSYY